MLLRELSLHQSTHKGDTMTTPILSKLEKERVFSVQIDGHGFCFVEECDTYFALHLSRAEVFELAAELIALANGGWAP